MMGTLIDTEKLKQGTLVLSDNQMTFDETYIAIAELFAKHSKAIRKQVGAVLVTPNGTILQGYNGTPHGMDNSCEDEHGVTLKVTLHAELNCILQAAREGVYVKDSTIYTTLSPCQQCSAMIIQAGIKRVVYSEEYRDIAGVNYLREGGIEVQKL